MHPIYLVCGWVMDYTVKERAHLQPSPTVTAQTSQTAAELSDSTNSVTITNLAINHIQRDAGSEAQSTPLVEGTSALPLRATAARRASAVALNADSARWWSLSPYKHSTCRQRLGG